MIEQVKLLFRLYYKPLDAMSRIIDEGNWIYGAIAAVAVTLFIQFAFMAPMPSQMPSVHSENRQQVPSMSRHSSTPSSSANQGAHEAVLYDAESEEVIAPPMTPGQQLSARIMQIFSPFSGWMTIPALALLYIPATIFLISLMENIGSFGVAFRRDYGALLACTMMAWAAAHLPLALAELVVITVNKGHVAFLLLAPLAKLYFAFLMVCALRRVCGARFSRAIGVVSVSWVAMLLQSILWMLASPFLLFYAYFYFRGEASGLTAVFSNRQSFRRHLEAATINPRDSEAHYQLGLIYQQRLQYDKAIHHFKQAVEINNGETDAHYQLGRIARLQGRLQEAIAHFSEVVNQDERHAHSEVWREIGATYLAAAMYEDARAALETYVERREYDPEALFHMGMTLQKLDRREEAQEMFRRCAEAARTKLYDRTGQSKQWGKQAEKQLRESSAHTA